MTCPDNSLASKFRVFEDNGVLGSLGVCPELVKGELKIINIRAEISRTLYLIEFLLFGATIGLAVFLF
jgi:hypothetical protein